MLLNIPILCELEYLEWPSKYCQIMNMKLNVLKLAYDDGIPKLPDTRILPFVQQKVPIKNDVETSSHTHHLLVQ